MAYDDFRNRLRRNARHWGKWARRRGIECYRLYDRDIPELAYCLDRYGEHAHLQQYRRGGEDDPDERDAAAAEACLAVADALEMPLERVHFKRRAERRAGVQQAATGAPGEELVVHEGGHRFQVDLDAHLDTGLFLDHRNTRRMVADEARGRRLLNLFCYTGSFTVYAAAGGAASSLSIDLSNTYLDWAARNFALNRMDRTRHALIRADVLEWLDQALDEGRRYDLVVLDPPSFSNSKAMAGVLDVQRDHGWLIANARALLDPGGELYFSTNLRTFTLDQKLAADPGGRDITGETLPEDFRDRRIHRAWRFGR
jgi:23S rRNA (cytosine1962-C5)-methyltransferase